MKSYVLDANAVMRYLQKGPGFESVRELFKMAQRGNAHLMMSVINRGEVLYSLARRAGLPQATNALKTLAASIELIDASEGTAYAAAILKRNYKPGYADCYAAELAMRAGATLVTADPECVKLGRKIKILALPRHSG